MSNLRYILGTATIALITGGTIYAIKKSKDMKKTEESEISLAEARAEVEARREAEMEAAKAEVAEEFEELMEDIRDNAHWTNSFMRHPENDVDEECVEDEEDEEEPIEDDNEYTEDGELRYEPNSMEARDQYIKMNLAEWRPLEDTYQTMLKLFEFPFNPQNDGDHMTLTQIIDYRVQFFGFGSKWVKDISIADVILHYARVAEFDCGEDVRYWVEYFLEFNELDFRMSSHAIDQVLTELNSHTYFNKERQTFGLFGLSRESMDQAIKIANRNIDNSLTYEIEFNEFLKTCL